eukprot:SAG22_NODE_470_length_10142_cov_13.947227_9_plen_132_part_00
MVATAKVHNPDSEAAASACSLPMTRSAGAGIADRSSSSGVIKVLRSNRGRRMTPQAFELLSAGEQKRVLRNRRNALKTRRGRQAKLEQLQAAALNMKASIQRKEVALQVLAELEVLLFSEAVAVEVPAAGS